MSEESTPSAGESGLPPPAEGAHSGLRLLASIDQRIRAQLGGSSRAHPPDSEGLLKALDEYLQTREALARKQKEGHAKATRKDLAWLWALVAGVLLLGTLIPDSLFEKLRYKEYGEKILTYMVGAGLLTKWVRSPKDLILASRAKWFHWVAGSVLGVSLLLAIDIVKVDATWDPADTQVYLDGSTERLHDHIFRTRLRGIEVRLLKPEIQTNPATARERFLTISLKDLLSHAKLSKSGLLVGQTWRMYNNVVVECIVGHCFPPVTLSFTLQGAEFDDAFTTYLNDTNLRWSEHPASFEVKFEQPGDRQFQFLSGKYAVVAKREHCTEELKPKEVGDAFEPNYIPDMTTCIQ